MAVSQSKLQHLSQVYMMNRLRGLFGDVLFPKIEELLVNYCEAEQISLAYAASLLFRKWSADNSADNN